MERIIATCTIASLLLWTGFVPVSFAQVASDTPPDSSPVVEVVNVDMPPAGSTTVPDTQQQADASTTTTTEVVVPDATTTPTQEGSNPQNASSSPLIQGAESGQDAVLAPPTDASTTISTSTPSDTQADATDTPPVADATSSDMQQPQDQTPPTELPQEQNPSPQETQEQPVVQQDNPPPVVVAPADLAPDPEYVFSVHTGKRIDTKRVVKKGVMVGKNIITTDVVETVSALPTISADNTNGVLNVSGSCTDKYYAILVFKNPEDYERDRNAYIVNRSYPCTTGSFSVTLSDLPPTLPDGTYYVMVGSQGDWGPWTPITGLSEVQINNNQHN